MNEWLHRKGTLTDGPWETVVDASLEGWHHTGLRIAELKEQTVSLPAGDTERIVIPLHGAFDVVYTEGHGATSEQHLYGRTSVFAGPTDVLFLGAGTGGKLHGTGRIAVAESPTTNHRPARYIPAREVPVDLRGAGKSTRQVHSFGMEGVMEEPDRLLVCEVITPADNWSSYPPHKHDENIPGHEAELEEIYYFEATPTSEDVSQDGAFGVFHTYPSASYKIAIGAIVCSGDVALVPHGYHGPAAAAPGYDLYYLNVMAGPGERKWRATDDPAHAWVRETWADQATDERLPLRVESQGS